MSARRWLGTVAVVLALAGGRTTLAQNPRMLPEVIGDLNAVQLVEVIGPNAEILLQGTMKTTSNTPKETERKADLVSPTGQPAKGEVEFEIEHKPDAIKSEVEVDLEKLPVNTQCELRLDGKAAATFLTTKKGKAEFELERKETAPAPSR